MTAIRITRFRNRDDNATRGTDKRKDLTWPDLVALLSVHQRRDSKEGIGWAPVTFVDAPCACGAKKCRKERGHRTNENVVVIHALTLDVDKTTAAKAKDRRQLDRSGAEAALARLKSLDLTHVAHTTHSHAYPDHASFRVTIALSRSVTAVDWPVFFAGAMAHLDIPHDPTSRNTARFWYLPSCAASSEPIVVVHDGKPLDVDLALSIGRAAAPPAPVSPRQLTKYVSKSSDFQIRDLMSAMYPGIMSESGRSDVDCEWHIGLDCPWKHEHTSADVETGAIVWLYTSGAWEFKCLHSHCDGRNGDDFRSFHDPSWIPFHLRPTPTSRTTSREPPPDLNTVDPEAEAIRADQLTPTTPFDGAPHPSSNPDPAAQVVDYHLTELGNADRLADATAAVLRYVHPWKSWLSWDGTRWRRDDRGSNQEAAKTVVRELFTMAASARIRADRLRAEHADVVAAASTQDRSKEAKQTRDSARQSPVYQEVEKSKAIAEAMLVWAMRSSTAKVIGNMATLARSEPRIVAEPGEFDSEKLIFNVRNGTLDLETGKLHAHRQSDKITKMGGTVYNPSAYAPRWEQFLVEIHPDPEMRDWLQRWFGYCLTGLITEQVMLFALGLGANGKNLLLDTIKLVMGDYATTCAPDLLMLKNNDEHPTGFADLHGHRLVLSSEIDRGRKWSESTIKRLTGDATIKARRMREDFMEFETTHKHSVLANYRPEVQGTDHGIWRRIRLAPFSVTIARPDLDLPRKLAAEREGIFAWAVRGCMAWQRAGRLGEVPAMSAAVAEYRRDQDVVGEWLAERCLCVCGPDVSRWTDGLCAVCGAAAELHAVDPDRSEEPWSDVYPDFRAWQEDRGIRNCWTLPTFRTELLKRPGVMAARTKSWRGVSGLRLRRIAGAGLSTRSDRSGW